MALQFTRNAKVYLVESTGGQAWQVNVLEDFSFSQTVNSTEIVINEAGATSRRARLLFNDNLAPAEWSFSTYAKPFSDGAVSPAQIRCPEEALWAMLVAADGFTAATGVFDNNTNAINAVTTTTNTFDFSESNKAAMPDTWDIYVAFEDGSNKQYFKIDSAVVNAMTIDFDIEGIATIQWSGFGATIGDAGKTQPAAISSARTTGLSESCNVIRNRISTVSVVRTDVSPDDTYNIILTGGSITVENNITYLVPEELGVVNQPCINVTGARSISGNITCYLDNDISGSKSGELFADLVADTTTVRNVFDMAINIGGETASTPRVTFDIPTAHLEVPEIGVEDLVTLNVAFHGQPSNGDADNTDEMTIIYKA